MPLDCRRNENMLNNNNLFCQHMPEPGLEMSILFMINYLFPYYLITEKCLVRMIHNSNTPMNKSWRVTQFNCGEQFDIGGVMETKPCLIKQKQQTDSLSRSLIKW